MRKHVLTLAMLFLSIGFAWGQTFTFNPDTVFTGTPVTLTLTGTGTDFNLATQTNFRHAQSGYNFSVTGTVNTPTEMTMSLNFPGNSPLGKYILTANGNFLQYTSSDSLFVSPPGGAFGTIEGKVIEDRNSNCVEDAGDVSMVNQVMTIQPGPYYALTDANGTYSAVLPVGNYTIEAPASPTNSFNCPPTGILSANVVVPLDTVRNLDFFQDSIQIRDLEITTVPPFAARPGFTVTYLMNVVNLGNTPVSDVKAHFLPLGNINYLSAFPVPTSVSTDSVSWNLGTMAGGANMMIQVTCSISTAASIGSLINWYSSVEGFNSEINYSNNQSEFIQAVTGSYDPNDKQVWNAAGAIADGFVEPTDSVLSYLIRFQNTGTDTAFNIVVRDTLDMNLDPATLRVTGESHPMDLSIVGNGRLAFAFDNILLPDSNINEPESHGYVAYTIERRDGLPLGTALDNTAHIYFDFNAPIVTNTVSSVICPSLSSGFSYSAIERDVDFTNTSTGSFDMTEWDFGDGTTSTQANPSHIYALDGVYTVCLTTSSACGRTATTCDTIVVVVSNILEETTFSSLEVYPNPTREYLSVSLEAKPKSDLELKVFDLHGRMLFETSTSSVQGRYQEKLDLRGLPSGLYQLKVRVGEEEVYRKVVLE